MFNSYEELMAAAKARREAVLTLEVDLGGAYSPEHEAAKTELQQAKAMRQIVGGTFLGGDNIEELEQRVEATRPEPNSIWIQYRKLDLDEWSKLITTQGLNPIGQYEKVLPACFIGVYGQDPQENPDLQPLSTDGALVSTRGGEKSILPGGSLNSVVQSFMAWQNSGGDVTIRPTRSGLD